MLILQLRNIQGGLQHAAARSEKEQIVINQGRRQRLGLAAEKSTTATDQAHAAIATHLQVRAGQAARLPETLQESSGPITVPAGERQHPAGRPTGVAGVDECETQFRPQPCRQLPVEIKTCQSEHPIPPTACGISGCAALRWL